MSLNRVALGVLLLVAVLAIGFLLGWSAASWDRESRGVMIRRFVKWTLIVGGVFIVAIQLIPYGRAHANPPVQSEPEWDSATTRELAVKACFDCHSNETQWPWYSNLAPASWLVQRDVDGGRSKANWSEWGSSGEDESNESAETVLDGSMPPRAFMLLHPEARLSEEELEALADGLEATFGSSGG